MHECVIGVLYDYDNTRVITFDELKEEVEAGITKYEYAKQYMAEPPLPKLLSEYLDRRKSTGLERFAYCPYCGKKIDWKGLRGNADSK